MKKLIASAVAALLLSSAACAAPVWDKVDTEMTKQDVKATYGGSVPTKAGDGIYVDISFQNTRQKVSEVEVSYYYVSADTLLLALTGKYGQPESTDTQTQAEPPARFSMFDSTTTEKTTWHTKDGVKVVLTKASGRKSYTCVTYYVADTSAAANLAI